MSIPPIQLHWSEPVQYDKMEKSNYPGFYCIMTYYLGKPSKLLYIGQSFSSSIKSRMADHKRKWLNKYNGTRISFAPLSYYDKVDLADVLCIENALIYAYQPIENTQGISTLRPDFEDHLFMIKNTGSVPIKMKSSLNMAALLDSYEPGTKKKRTTPRKSTKNDDGYVFSGWRL